MSNKTADDLRALWKTNRFKNVKEITLLKM